jgi:CTP:molybdopterin cytidylyltransferase MocA
MATAAVILAAGRGSRFGQPKAAVRIGARSLVEVVIDAATAAGLRPVIVVAPSGIPVPASAQHVVNDRPDAGLSRSLHLGVAAVPAHAEAAVILLADQPTVSVDHLRALDGWRGGTPIVATRTTDTAIGPPLLLERDAFGLTREAVADRGLRALLRERPDLVTPVDHPPIPDVDTPADLEAITEACPGCRTRYLPHRTDETHAYIGASAACWATFGELLAREFEDVQYGRMHRHTVDIYAAQHPGTDERRQRQSVALHLIALCHWLEHEVPVERLNALTQGLATADRPWPWLPPPERFAMTVADVLAARNGVEHGGLVRRWGIATWSAWSAHHDVVRAWAREALGGG